MDMLLDKLCHRFFYFILEELTSSCLLSPPHVQPAADGPYPGLQETFIPSPCLTAWVHVWVGIVLPMSRGFIVFFLENQESPSEHHLLKSDSW